METVDFRAIHEGFAQTVHGHALASNVRYAIYKPDTLSNEEWVELLGPDVNNLTHLIVTDELTATFIEDSDHLQPGELSTSGRTMLRLTAISHDWGESLPHIGDVNYSDKTMDHGAAERQAFVEHLSEFYTDGSLEVETLIKNAVETVIFNRSNRLGRIFNAIERIGYLQVAVRAAQHLHDETAPEECVEGLVWLTTDTLSNHHITHLIAAGRHFPASHLFLDRQQDELSRTFEMAEPAVFERQDPRRASTKQKCLADAESVWNTWYGEAGDQ